MAPLPMTDEIAGALGSTVSANAEENGPVRLSVTVAVVMLAVRDSAVAWKSKTPLPSAAYRSDHRAAVARS